MQEGICITDQHKYQATKLFHRKVIFTAGSGTNSIMTGIFRKKRLFLPLYKTKGLKAKNNKKNESYLIHCRCSYYIMLML